MKEFLIGNWYLDEHGDYSLLGPCLVTGYTYKVDKICDVSKVGILWKKIHVNVLTRLACEFEIEYYGLNNL